MSTAVKKSTLYIRQIPNDVKNNFKAHCAERGLSLQDGIIELMREAVSGNHKNPTRRRTS